MPAGEVVFATESSGSLCDHCDSIYYIHKYTFDWLICTDKALDYKLMKECIKKKMNLTFLSTGKSQ